MPATYRTQLKKVRGLGSAMGGPGTDHFWAQRMTAVSNIFATGFLVYAGLSLAGASRPEVKAFFVNPVHAILGILLIVSATVHMRLGMQVIVEEYAPRGLKVPCMFLNTFLTVITAVACVLSLIKLNLGV
ncbi:MAG: succinate dehydrogenase, hydrophobic membrane anchor protein [Rhodomicrobium sp.]|jgi:succinate dehydrogenase / fumarate reductase membrane anchor subunit